MSQKRITTEDIELLSAYMDGECANSAAFEARLVAEPELAAHLQKLATTRSLLNLLPEPRTSHDFANRVTQAAYGRKSSKTMWRWSLPAAAAALVLIGTGYALFAPRQNTPLPAGISWQDTMTAVADSGDVEAIAEWVDEDATLDETPPEEFIATLARLTLDEEPGAGAVNVDLLDSTTSVFDLVDDMSDEDAALFAAMLRHAA